MTKEPRNCHRILVVDDNPSVVSLLRHALTAEGYEVIVAEDGLAALHQVTEQSPDLILLDIELPYLSGEDVCRRLKRAPETRWIPIVMLTGLGASQNKITAWDNGADDFLTKPVRLIEVIARCRSLLRIRRLIQERDSAEAVVFALARAVEAKSPFTHGHSERVMQHCLAMAFTIGISEEERELLRKGSLLHDIGKISLPDAILNKPSQLTPEEFDLVKQHPVQGAHIVEPLVSVRDAVPLIRWHHERLDGTGYPDGLRGEEVPLLVRILSVCDVYDSLASDRPYRAPIPHVECLKILRENALNGGLDPELVAIFSDMARDDGCLKNWSGMPAELVHQGD